MNTLILHDFIPDNADPDVLDVVTEVRAVRKSLNELGHVYETLAISTRLDVLKKTLIHKRPDLIINLVESFNGSGELAYKIPELLERLNIPFTGAKSKAVKTTTNKKLTKTILIKNGIETPKEIILEKSTSNEAILPGYYIIKPACEDASIGVEENSVDFFTCRQDIIRKIGELNSNKHTDWIIESYIEGREFNVGIAGNTLDVQVFPPAEIRFNNYGQHKHRVLGYRAKWIEDSFEYQNTTRHFDFNPTDSRLLDHLKSIAKSCWSVFNLTGYARVDFRVDNNGVPYVLEINANPCISPDAGIVAAAAQSGLNYTDFIKTILDAALIN